MIYILYNNIKSHNIIQFPVCSKEPVSSRKKEKKMIKMSGDKRHNDRHKQAHHTLEQVCIARPALFKDFCLRFVWG